MTDDAPSLAPPRNEQAAKGGPAEPESSPSPTLSRPSSRARRLARRDVGIPFGVLAVGLLFTLFASLALRQTDESRDRERFEEIVGIVHAETAARLDTYVALLRAGRGLFDASREVEAGEFHQFVASLDLAEHYRDIRGFGFAERLSPEEVPAFEAARRAEGRADYRVWPDTPRADYFPIKHLEPLDARNVRALGYDMFTEPTRRAAMERARDEGGPAATGRVELVQENEADRQAGFLIYLPVYDAGEAPESVAERRARLRGFIYSPFRAGDFFRAALGERFASQLAAEVHDGAPAPENLLFRSKESGEEGRPGLTDARRLPIAGRSWTILYSALPAFEASTSRFLPLVPALGTLISLLLAGIAWSLVASRNQARQAASERRRAEAALAERETRLRHILNTIFAFVGVLDGQGRVLEVNRAALDAARLRREDVAGRPFWDVFWGDADPERARLMREAVAKAGAGERVRRDVEMNAGGETRILDLQVAPLPGENGRAASIVSFGVDITERKRAEAHRETLMAEFNHRLKNSLAVIQSIARQTGARSNSVADFLTAFQGRLSALGAAHGLLMEAGWRATRLDSVIRAALKPHLAREDEQLAFSADPVTAPAELAQNIALVVHELATNAVKYGALAAPDGRIAVTARRGEAGLVISWTEHGGAGVRAPERQGFGTTLLRALIVGRHGGTVDFDWREDGLSVTLTIPAAELAADGDDETSVPSAARA